MVIPLQWWSRDADRFCFFIPLGSDAIDMPAVMNVPIKSKKH